MKLIFFTDRPNNKENELLIEEARSRGHNAVLQCPWNVDLPKNMDKADIVYVTSPLLYRGSTYEFINRYSILRQYSEKGIFVINPLDSLFNHTKENFTMQTVKHAIPHPRTLITENIDTAYHFIMKLQKEGKSAVIKPVASGGGKGVVLLKNQKDARQYLSYYSRFSGGGVFYVQEFIENLGYDVRVFIIGNKIAGRMKRSNPEDFRYNASLGGVVDKFASPKFDQISLKVAKIMDFKICGVDILPSVEEHSYILEVNGCPGFRHLNQATGIKIQKKIIEYFEQRIA